MRNKYLIRLDDACPTMDAVKWQRMEDILDAVGIRPMVGIIPHNEDPKQFVDKADNCFWNKALRWKEKGWAIALHGFNHCYISDQGMKGLNPLWARSEFVGVPLEIQCEKIRAGIAIMREYKLEPNYFFAPSHTFDKNTLIALQKESRIRMICDTISLKPYKQGEFLFIPQIAGHCVKISLPGVFTFCFHPNTMNNEAFGHLEKFLVKYRKQFVAFSDLNSMIMGKKRMIDHLLSWMFFTYRKIRG